MAPPRAGGDATASVPPTSQQASPLGAAHMTALVKSMRLVL
eukprot:CAMPEP_0175676304 /NCGR_PEP_ID=MMETSP0097-20121207/22673_1 /TAXON_ID=311494 /ORGANISM="Alexandrium monilatum, Strain CCMP3105" /LENGTH=40 /DNA_ID= /DNA_START= /DNA_END= /DNA_ORIENTATION=